MKYIGLIKLIKKHQTSRVKAISIADSCAPASIPAAFRNLIKDIIILLEKNFKELAKGKSFIGVFGLQTTGVTLESTLPIFLNRRYTPLNARSHLCCSLFYLPIADEARIPDWSGTESLVIDFTRGFIMDQTHFLYEALKSGKKGKVYGYLDDKKLTAAWQKVQNAPLHSFLN